MNKEIFIGTIGLIASVAALFVFSAKTSRVDLGAKYEQSKDFAAHFPNSALLWGEVDAGMLAKLGGLSGDIDSLVLHSHGGASPRGLEAAKLISSKGYSVDVPSLCTSTCAEFFLPAATSITFSNLPLIGYDGTALSETYAAAESLGNDKKYCHAAHALEVETFYHEAGVPLKFWRKIQQKLDVQDVDLTRLEKTDCVMPSIKTKHDMWFPTSAQLSKIFGLTFKGEVCADSPDCYEAKLSDLYGETTGAGASSSASVVVGNKVFYPRRAN